MGELGTERLPFRTLSAMKLFAWCLSVVGLLLMGSVIVGHGGVESNPHTSPSPTTFWPVAVEGGDDLSEVSLRIPLLIDERILPTDSTITYSISFEDRDISELAYPAVWLERPLHMATATWDGVDVQLYSSHGGNPLDGDSVLLGQLPVGGQAEGDTHVLTVTLRGAHGYLGVAGNLIVGEFAPLERSQQSREFKQVFGSSVLTVTGVILLLIGLYSSRRSDFVTVGIFSILLGLTLFSLSDMWAVMPGGLEYRLRVRHAAIALCPFFGLSWLLSFSQIRQGAFMVFVGGVSFALAIVSLGWHDSTILPSVRQVEQGMGGLALIYGVAKTFKYSLQGVFEARVVLFVVLSLFFGWSMVLRESGLISVGSWLIFVLVGVSISLMMLLIRRYLKASERYAKFVAEALDAILVVDLNGVVVESNASGWLLLGGDSGTVNLYDKVEPLDVDLCRDHLTSLDSRRAELRFPSSGGGASQPKTVFVESVAMGLKGDLVLLVLRDVSQRRQIEGRIISSVRMETLGIVARGIAHDYNNTLSAVLGQLTMLGHEVPSIDKGLIHQIERKIVETSERTRKQLAIVRGGHEPSRSVDPIDLVEGASQLITGTLPDNVFLIKNFGEELPSVNCKAVEIEQVLLNLVSNARDVLANQDGGQIELTAYKADDNFVVFSVTDDGPIIPVEHAHMVWSPFFSSNGRELGAGLVLSVVQRVVREHGGRVSHETPENGKGARFQVYIPTSEFAAHSEPSVASTRLGQVLVVEDEPNIREVIVSILQLRGFTVSQAESSEVAREQFAPEDFQLLVTDVIMGPENGISLASYFTKVNPKLAVLVVSGQVPEKLEAHDTWAFLDKPFTPEMLVASSRKAILLSKTHLGEAMNE